MKRMLINASQPEELRLALVDGQSLYDFDLEQIGYERKRANIYKARVSRIEQSLGAAFIDYGAERHGFLPMKDIAPQYFPKGKFSRNSSIKDCLKEGQEILILDFRGITVRARYKYKDHPFQSFPLGSFVYE